MTNRLFPINAAKFTRVCSWLLLFIAALLPVFLLLFHDSDMGGTSLSQSVYALGGAVLIAALFTHWASTMRRPTAPTYSRWFCPLAAGGLTLCVTLLAFAYIGIWPLGEKTTMIVDMHHQYAPLLSELRSMILDGDSFTYSFHIGLGANFIPAFAYYLASPLNILLLLFPERLLAEGIFVIMILKIALAAVSFAACAQYLLRSRNAAVIAISVLYATMLYMLAYSWNIMWLDVVALMPLVVLCAERMLRGGSMIPYALALGLALFANYYIGFMLCIFLVLYFVVFMLRRARPLDDWWRRGARFAIGSVLGAGLAAAILVPTALALGRTSAAGGEMPSLAANFDLFDLIGRLYYGATPTIRSGNLPNLYCGVMVTLLLPLYLMIREIPLRRRLCYGALAALTLLSCTINGLDMLWHGLHAPNDLPYRFSFIACFVMLLLAGKVLQYLHVFSPQQIAAVLGGGAVYLIVWERFGGVTAPSDIVVYGNLLLIALYGIILLLASYRRLRTHAARLLILVLVVAELTVSAATTLKTMDGNEYYTAHTAYVDNADTAADAAAIARAQELAEQEGELFARLEYLPRSTCMDTALHHYKGLTTFASSNPYETTVLMGDLGYAINGVNSYLYKSFVATADALFGIRYVVLENDIGNHAQLTLVDTVTVQEVTRYIYRNETALPVGFYGTDATRDYVSQKYAPFTAQESLYTALVGQQENLYDSLSLESESPSSTIGGSSFVKYQSDASAIYSGTVEEVGQYFAFVDCRAAETLTVETFDADGGQKNNWSVTTYEPYIIDLGTMRPQERVEVFVEGEGTISGNIYVVKLDTAAFERQIERLRAHALTVTAVSDRSIVGTVDAPKDGMLYLSIPYDKGWQAILDGSVELDTFPIAKNTEGTDGALLGVDLPAGKHAVTLIYHPPGLTLGVVISLLSILVLLAIRLYPYMRDRRRRPITPPDAQ